MIFEQVTHGNIRPVTKFVVLKVTYNAYSVEPPDTWDWNELIEAGPGEKVELVQVSDIPIVQKTLF